MYSHAGPGPVWEVVKRRRTGRKTLDAAWQVQEEAADVTVNGNRIDPGLRFVTVLICAACVGCVRSAEPYSTNRHIL